MSGVPLENHFAETRRPYQLWGVPTQKGEASKKKALQKTKPFEGLVVSDVRLRLKPS